MNTCTCIAIALISSAAAVSQAKESAVFEVRKESAIIRLAFDKPLSFLSLGDAPPVTVYLIVPGEKGFVEVNDRRLSNALALSLKPHFVRSWKNNRDIVLNYSDLNVGYVVDRHDVTRIIDSVKRPRSASELRDLLAKSEIWLGILVESEDRAKAFRRILIPAEKVPLE
jgi:hypothetical protein